MMELVRHSPGGSIALPWWVEGPRLLTRRRCCNAHAQLPFEPIRALHTQRLHFSRLCAVSPLFNNVPLDHPWWQRRVGDSTTHALFSVHACAHASLCVGAVCGVCLWVGHPNIRPARSDTRQGVNEDKLLEISISKTEIIKIYW